MLNAILFGIIGLLMFSVVGVGGYAVHEHVAQGDSAPVSQIDDAVLPADTNEAANTQANTSSAPGSQASQETTECFEVRVPNDDDWDEDDEDGDDEDDFHTEVRCVTKTVDTAPPSPTETNTPAPTSNIPAPSVPTTPAPSAGAYTLAQVATHNTRTDCWTAIGGVVYDLTPFISQHPGGVSDIMRICGIDGTSAFQNQHGSSGKPASELANLKIGTLAQ